MENLENMEEIEALQTELGQFLISIIPVPWKKICYYAEVEPGCISPWISFIEQETEVICTEDFFWERYDHYPVRRRDVLIKLSNLTSVLHKAYIRRFGEDKKWCAMFYFIEEDYSVHIDLEYDFPKGDMFEQHDAVFRKIYHTEYKAIKGKYPATE